MVEVNETIGIGRGTIKKPVPVTQAKVTPEQTKTDQKEKELNYNVGNITYLNLFRIPSRN
jgi:hypothetical protein